MPFFARSPLRKLSRKQARRRTEADGIRALTFELEMLEFVAAGDDLGLLRVAGRWTAPAWRSLQDIALVIRGGEDTIELQPLPDPEGAVPLASPDGEPWRAAYTASAELIEDPDVELALIADDDEAPVAIPRPGDWEPPAAVYEDEEEEDEGEAGDEPWNAELENLADLQIQAERLAEELEAREADEEPEPDKEPEIDEPADPEPVVVAESVAVADPEELAHLREELAEARSELDAERSRREALEEEMRARATVEDDLRNAIAMQEAELAAAVAQATQRARRAERQSAYAANGGGDASDRPRVEPIDNEFLARLERAHRAAEAAS